MKKEYAVSNMKCSGCQAAVERVVSGVEGVSQLQVDLAQHKISFEAEEGFQEGSLKETLKNAGYPIV